jgi:hypothetical protein
MVRGLAGVQSWSAIPSGLTVLSERTSIHTKCQERSCGSANS